MCVCARACVYVCMYVCARARVRVSAKSCLYGQDFAFYKYFILFYVLQPSWTYSCAAGRMLKSS